MYFEKGHALFDEFILQGEHGACHQLGCCKPFNPGQTTKDPKGWQKVPHVGLGFVATQKGAVALSFLFGTQVRFHRVPPRVPGWSGGKAQRREETSAVPGQRTCFSQAQTVSVKLSPTQAHLYSVALANFGGHPCRSAPHSQLLCSANLVLI